MATLSSSDPADFIIVVEADDPMLDLVMAHPRWREVSDVIASADHAEGIGMADDHVSALRRKADHQYAQLTALVRRKLLPRPGRPRAACARLRAVISRQPRPRARRTRTTSGARKAPVDDEPAGPEHARTDETRQSGQRK